MLLSSISLALTRLGQRLGRWSPTTLFAAGEAGGLWDFSTLANLYQDSAGTTPCTAVGQPIGLVLDTKNGTPQLGPELVTNGDFSSGATGWTEMGPGWSVSGGTAVGTAVAGFATIGQDTAATVIGNTYEAKITVSNYSAGQVYIYVGSSGYSSAISANGSYTFRLMATGTNGVFVRGDSGFTGSIDNISVREIPGNHLTQSTSTKRPVLGRMPATGVRNLLVNTATLSTQNVTTLAGNYTIQFTGAGSVTASGTYSGALTNGQTFTCTAGTLTLTVSGSVTAAQLEAGSTATAKQVVGAVYDVTESGVASVYTAYFDGVDDCLVSPSIDFSGTDKMSVFAGVRKTTETGLLDCLLECADMFASTTGAFCLHTKANSVAGNAAFGSRGTMDKYSLRVLPTDTSAILTGVGNIGAPSVNLSVSGVSGEATTTNQGGGTYPNSLMTVGSRITKSYYVKGFLSALAVRGAATDATTITSMEKWMAARTPGVTLP